MITGILLAAGAGTRFGGGKLRHPFGPERVPIAIASLRTLRSVLPEVQVVIRPGEPELQKLFADENVPVTICERAVDGMGYSLAAAVAASSPESTGWIIALGDMPRVAAATFESVKQALESGASIVIPTYRGRRGHPVGFARGHGDALRSLSGDEGARRIVAANAAGVLELPVDDAGVLADVDTREDLRRLEG